MMKTISLKFLVTLLFFSSLLFSCSNREDDSRAFMSSATVVGNAEDGFYCYLDGGGLVISHSHELDGIERGYFAFHYNESDWITSSEKGTYIENAQVYPYSQYDVIRPLSIEDAKKTHIFESNSNVEIPLFTMGNVCRGYFDMNTGLSLVNIMNGDQIAAVTNIIYDPAKQTPDSLFLLLHYSLQKPASWTNTGFKYGAVSCDISSLKKLQQWSDSVTITIDAGDKLKHFVKISRNDFSKPIVN